MVDVWVATIFFVVDLAGILLVYIKGGNDVVKIILTVGLIPSLIWAGYKVYSDATKHGLSIALKHKPVSHTRVLSVYNGSDFDISDVQIHVEWRQEDGPQERDLRNFLPANSNMVMDSPSELEVLIKGQTYWSNDCPHHSVDGKMKIIITGMNMTNQERIKYEENISCPTPQ